MPVIAVFLCPNLVRRIATKGPDPIVREVMIEEAMAASALPETQFFYIFFSTWVGLFDSSDSGLGGLPPNPSLVV